MARVLYLLVHPTFEKSKANKSLFNCLPSSSELTVRDLYECYPDFDIDIKREQELLSGHDVLMIQHPFYWYSAPPLLKQWIDLVLEHGWAYGNGGDNLSNKKWIQVITTGGNDTAYTKAGFHKNEMKAFLLPFQRTAELCNMIYLDPYLVHGIFQKDETDLEKEGKLFSKFLTELLGKK